jgi:hypothetical protein
MLRRGHINRDPRRRSLRLLLGVADAVRWPFERAAWTIERQLVWPLRERAAGWGPPRQLAGAGALGAIAAVAVAVGVLWPSGGHSGDEVAATSTPVTIPTPETRPQAREARGPVLHGAPPSFGVGKGVGVSQAASGQGHGAEAEAPTATPEASAGATQVEEETLGATASSAKPAPAGPAAMKVARDFSEAFVFYEIGEHPGRAKAVFAETATPQLASALGERPPRLPAGAKVPKARVVNLVPGPRAGKAYTVSVSLLRVGLTSELRLTLQHGKNDGWQVADILG